MVYCKTDEEVELIRESSLLVAKTLAEVAKAIRPGIQTVDIDRLAEEYIKDHGALPAFKGYRGFPYTLCISLNAEVVHGMPSDRELKEGDILSVDCGVLKNHFYGDSAYTFPVGLIDESKARLLHVTRECLMMGIAKAIEGYRIGDISSAIQEHAEKNGYGVVRELVGHGIGKNLHESPEVPNYGKKGTGMKLKEGMVIAIEPMINMGRREVREEKDGWTITTKDGLPSAHYEHTVAIRKDKTDVLTTFNYIEEALNK